MKIAIVSDSHDNVINLEKILKWINNQKISVLIHAGDLSAPAILLRVLVPNFLGGIYLTSGNVGDPILLEGLAAKFNNIKYYKERGEFFIDNLKFGLVHEPEKTLPLIEQGSYDVIVYGHSHKSDIKQVGKTNIINPGTAGGLFNEATFAVFDTTTKNTEIIKVDGI